MSEISDRVSFAGRHGAGIYGRRPRRSTTCPHANNPFGHNKECVCGWWPPIPVDPDPAYPVSRWPDA